MGWTHRDLSDFPPERTASQTRDVERERRYHLDPVYHYRVSIVHQYMRASQGAVPGELLTCALSAVEELDEFDRKNAK